MIIGFIGLGLIGGSMAKAIKKADSNIKIVAYNRTKKYLDAAVGEGVVDEAALEVNEQFNQCDFIFLCTPVEHNLTYLQTLKNIIKKEAVITDVGSVKSYIHKQVIKLDLEANFIGGHPMAGSEKTSYTAANASILENAYYAITPTSKTKDSVLNQYIELVKMMGAIPIVIPYEKHDYAVAGISHVPHLIAASLVNTVAESDTEDGLMKLLAAGGFKDITRIASSSADMWSQICLTNSEQISLMLGRYIDYLTKVKEYVDKGDGDYIYNMFVDSKEYRDSINIGKKGPILPNYSFFCDIEDKHGALSEITILLSGNGINIKNIEIIHNREYKDGVLLLDFYDSHASEYAQKVLADNNYKTYR